MVTKKEVKNIKENYAIRYEVFNQYRKGKLNMIHVIGLPGTGKSWFCLRLAEQLYEDFHGYDEMRKDNIHLKVVQNMFEFVRAIRSAKKPGDIIIAEELATWLSSKRAMSTENVDAGFVFDTIRKKRIIIIANNPISDDVDKKMRRLSSLMIQTLSLNKGEGICVVKPLRLQTNPDTGKTYRHRLSIKGFEVHRCWSGSPKKELTDAYEEMKDSNMDDLYRRLEKKHKERIMKNDLTIGDKVAAVTPTESRRAKMRLRGLKTKEIAKAEGVSVPSIFQSLKAYDKKIKELNGDKVPEKKG
jgi:adenylate kinase family enzyme